MPFVDAPGIDLTDYVDLILLIRRQPSACFTIESPTIKVFFFMFSFVSFSGGLFPDLRPFAFVKLLLGLIYNITHETKKSQSPGIENLRCLGIQKKERKRKKKS